MTADRERALASYRVLAPSYDESCRRIRQIRAAAIEALALRPGETVFDVACGTGEALVQLARQVGPRGLAIGIEQCPEMADQARRRIHTAGLADRARLIVAPVEEAPIVARADALLFCYTHDVLQTPAALANLFSHAAPGARVAVVGMRLRPWSWGWPLNLFTLIHARHYVTTRRGFREPWAPLKVFCPDLAVVRGFHLGTSYLASGCFVSRPPDAGRDLA